MADMVGDEDIAFIDTMTPAEQRATNGRVVVPMERRA